MTDTLSPEHLAKVPLQSVEGFPARARHALRRMGVETVGQLMDIDDSELEFVNGFGEKAAEVTRELREALGRGASNESAPTTQDSGGIVRDHLDIVRAEADSTFYHSLEVLGLMAKQRIPDHNLAKEAVRITRVMQREAFRVHGIQVLDEGDPVDLDGKTHRIYRQVDGYTYPDGTLFFALVPEDEG